MNKKEFIRKFVDIKLSKICKDLDIDPSNVYSMRINDEKADKIFKKLDKEIKRLYEKE